MKKKLLIKSLAFSTLFATVILLVNNKTDNLEQMLKAKENIQTKATDYNYRSDFEMSSNTGRTLWNDRSYNNVSLNNPNNIYSGSIIYPDLYVQIPGIKEWRVGLWKNSSTFVSLNDAANVGTYQIRVCVIYGSLLAPQYCYNDMYMTVSQLANQKITWEEKQYEYTGQALAKPKATYYNGRQIPESSISVEDNKEILNVGTYTLNIPKYILPGGVFSNDGDSSNANVTFDQTTTTKTINVTKGKNFVNNLKIDDIYFGEKLNLSYDLTFGKGTEEITYFDNNDNKLSGVPTDVGIYRVKVTVPDNVNYFGVEAEETFEIKKAYNEVLTNPILNSFDYASKETIPEATEFKFGNDNILYKYFDENDNELDYIPTEVGRYYLIAIVNETKNYFQKESNKVYFEIIKINNSWNINPTIDSQDYKENLDLNLKFNSRFDSDKAIIEYFENDLLLDYIPTDAGKYKVRITIPGTRNFNFLEETLEFEIRKAQNEWISLDTAQELVYKEDTFKFNTKALLGNNKLQIKYYKDGVEIFDAPYNAGNYTIQLIIPNTKNYSGLEYQFNVKILKANYDLSNLSLPKLEFIGLNNIKYKLNGELPSSLSVRYEIYRGGNLVDKINSNGTYLVRAVFTNNDSNYNDVDNIEFKIIIKQNNIAQYILISLAFIFILILIDYLFVLKKKKEKFVPSQKLFK